VVAFCYVINVTLLTYGRLSYLENGLIFWSSLLFFVYSWWGNKIWGVIASSMLVAFAMLTGKMFGGLLLPALVLTIFFSYRNNRWKLIFLSIASFLATAVMLVLILYGKDFAAAYAYVGEQSLELYGLPVGLSSPWGFIEELISYGFSNRLFYIDIELGLFVICGGLFLISSGTKQLREYSASTIFALFWLCCAFAGLSPLSYSPIRYSLLLIPAIIVFCSLMFDNIYRTKKSPPITLGKTEIAVLLFIFWALVYQLVANFFFFNKTPERFLVWITLPAAIVLVIITIPIIKKIQPRLSRMKVTVILVMLLVTAVTVNAFRYYRWHIAEHNFNIKEANYDISQILNDNAVISGPYGPILTVDNNLKSFIHLFGVSKVDHTLFDRQPVTHIALEITNHKKALEYYPRLKNATQVATYWIRDIEVKLLNVSRVFDNPKARNYQPTEYERAMTFYRSEQYDSAFIYANHFYQLHPTSFSAGLLLSKLLGKRDQADRAGQLLISLANEYPTNFYLQIECAHFLHQMAMMRNDTALLETAKSYYTRAVAVNGYKGSLINNLYSQTMKRFSGQ